MGAYDILGRIFFLSPTKTVRDKSDLMHLRLSASLRHSEAQQGQDYLKNHTSYKHVFLFLTEKLGTLACRDYFSST